MNNDAASVQERQYRRMTTGPVSRVVLSMGIPAVIGMLVTSIYNSADTYFVGQLGTSASGAVGVVFSLMNIIQAVGFTIGQGASSLISRRLGEKDYTHANRIASTALLLAVAWARGLYSLIRSCGSLAQRKRCCRMQSRMRIIY